VELRGLEPLTSSMPWWPGRRMLRAASVDDVQGRAGAAISVQPGSPSVCPSRLERTEASGGTAFSAEKISSGPTVTSTVIGAPRAKSEGAWNDCPGVRLIDHVPVWHLHGSSPTTRPSR
jgi:hypothetical protein